MTKKTPLQFGNPVFAKPKNGRKVRKEDGAQLPAEGATVTHSSYYHRRQKDGDLTLTEVAAIVPAPAQAEAKAVAPAVGSDPSDQSNPTKIDKKSK